MFYRFWDQEERSDFNGGDFIELQYCRHPAGTPIERIVSCTEHWRNDSLYVSGDEDTLFYQEYDDIFTGGIGANLETGPMDGYGVNYYGPELTERIIKAILEKKPPESTKVLLWLYEARGFNGFYIFGV